MKIDYDLLKTVLTTLDEDEKFEMRTNDLRNKIGKISQMISLSATFSN